MKQIIIYSLDSRKKIEHLFEYVNGKSVQSRILEKKSIAKLINSAIIKSLSAKNTNYNGFQKISLSELIDLEIYFKKVLKFLIVLDVKPRSKFVNESFYRIRYPDVNFSNLDPVLHFWRFGYYEGRSPTAGLKPMKDYKDLDEVYIAISNKKQTKLFENMLSKNFEQI